MWGYFFIFTVTNSILSYFSFPTAVKFGIGFSGILWPLLFFLKTGKGHSALEKPPYERESLPSIPFWLLLSCLMLSLLPRFYQLTTLSAWPMGDEGFFAYWATELMKKWQWKFFFGYHQDPPLFTWALAFFFRIFRPSFFSMWLFPALLSVSTLMILYWAARKAFSRSFSFILLIALAFSFWPWYLGRFCVAEALLPLWEAMTFAALAYYWKSNSPKGKRNGLLLLGLLAGMGFFAAKVWILVAFSVLLAVLGSWWKNTGNRGQLPFFFIPFFILISSFLAVSYLEKNGEYVQKLWDFKSIGALFQPWNAFYSHFEALFWGSDWKYSMYGPVWGGMLNPISGALLFLGAMECYRNRHFPLVRWVCVSFVCLFLPVGLVKGFDIFRISQILPFAFFLLAMGLQTLLGQAGNKKNILWAVLVLGLSTGLDVHHLWGRYRQTWGTPSPSWAYLKSAELWKAYQVLVKTREESEPGAVFYEFRTHLVDLSLLTAVYSFDACHDPDIPFQNSKWVAVIVDANYKPFLAGRFPKGEWYWLGDKEPYGGWMLGVIPVDPTDKGVFERWSRADEVLKPATSEVVNFTPGHSQKAILDRLLPVEDSMKGDLFLESCFWEKVLTHRTIDRDVEGSLAAIQEGLQKGYPLPQFFNEKGVILVQLGRLKEARKAFQEALKSPLDLTPARQNLSALKQSIKDN